MKFSKKALVLLLTLVMTFSIGLTGCNDDKKPVEPTPPKVASIEFTNTETSIGVGDFVIAAKCLPEKSAQEFTVKLDAPVMGVKLVDKTLTVHAGATNGATVSVTVASVEDPTKLAKKSFTLNIAAPTFVEVITADDLLNMMSSAENMAKNYILKDNITLITVAEEKPVDIQWKASEFPFTGLFDGAGFTIKGINMHTGDANTGFFKENTGVIRNVGFDNSAYPLKWMSLGANSGVVVGKNSGSISNVFTNVPFASASGTAGALVGTNSGIIENSYAIGATKTGDTAGDKAGVIGANTGVVKGVVADKDTTGISTFFGAKTAQSDTTANARLLNSTAMQTAKTFSDLGWSDTAWYLNSVYPMLKNEYFLAEDIVKSIKIVTPSIVEIGDLPAGNVKTVQLNLDRKNAAADVIDWSIKATTALVPGDTTITSSGVLTLNAPTATTVGGALDGVKVTVNAKIKDTEISSNAIIEIRNDGYTTQKGIEITTYDEMYDVFFRTSGETVDAHNRNITRTIKLKNDIALPAIEGATNPRVKAKYNWPGVLDFSGIFDGQGYSITGLDVTTGGGETLNVPNGDEDLGFDQNAAFGFFRRLGKVGEWAGDTRDKNAGGEPGTIRNLSLTNGKIRFVGPNRYDRRAIGGLVQMFGSGLIENVLVDLDIHSYANWSGMIVGQMGGVRSVNTAEVKGTAIIRNCIAMGKITSDLKPGEAPLRSNVDPYACGAIVGYTTTDGSELINCFARGVETPSKHVTCRLDDETDGGVIVNSAKIKNFAFKTAEELLLKSTFDGLGFPAIWAFKDGCYPMLKSGTWTDGDQKPADSVIEIVTKLDDIYYASELKDGTKAIDIDHEAMNIKDYAITYSIVPAVTGVAIDSATGVVTVDKNFAQTEDAGVDITVKVSLGTAASDTITFKIANSGYVPSVGLAIGTLKELQDNLIVNADRSNADLVARNLTRNIKLTANITLENKENNWPGIGDGSNQFTGNFDGQGHTIRGLNMTTVNGTWGFFKFVNSSVPGAVSIQNLGLEGKMNFDGGPTGDGDSRVAALVGEHRGGIIQNVVVDVDITAPNAKLIGKIAGYMEGTNNDKAEIRNCVTMGVMSGKAGYSSNWQKFSAGALVGKVEGGNNIIDSSFALIENRNTSTGIACRNPDDSGGAKPTNSDYCGIVKFIAAETYTGAATPFDPTIWSIVEGSRPMLINSIDATHPQGKEPAHVDITNTASSYERLKLTDNKLPIIAEISNAAPETVATFTLKENVTGVTIDAATGVITFAATVAHDSKITVIATIPGNISSEYTFAIYNDYDPAVGVRISNEEELYDNLIVKGDKSNEKKVALNMKRNIVLTQDIVLSAHKNWPGVKETFAGNFNGKGHTISGFDVNIDDSNDGYGFFLDVTAEKKEDVVIENLAMTGSITYDVVYPNADNCHIGGVAKKVNVGTVKNVLVNMTITTNGHYIGMTVGYLNTNAVIESSLALGTINYINLAEPGETRLGFEPLGTWEEKPAGLFLGKTEGSKMKNCYALQKAGQDMTFLDFTIRGSGEDGKIDSGFKTEAEMTAGTAFTGFDAAIWNFTAGQNPTLKTIA